MAVARSRIRRGKWATLALTVAVAATNTGAASPSPTDFSVEFTDCVESIGVALVPTANARPLVPAPFVLIGDGDELTPLVVRTARCAGVAVGGHPSEPGAVVQVGAVIVPPDGSGDINNYTLWYFTTSGHLAAYLRDAGLDAQHVETIDYEYLSGDGDDASFYVAVRRGGTSFLALDGSVVASVGPVIPFQANWWRATGEGIGASSAADRLPWTTEARFSPSEMLEDSRGGARTHIVKMATEVPLLDLGEADLRLTCDPASALGRLIGAGRVDFPVLQQFNLFDAAEMLVAINP